MRLQLVVVEGPHRGSVFALTPGQPLKVGRATSQEVCLPDATVSMRHAELWLDENGAWVRDLSSRHGCQVNGARIAPGAAHPLRPGDVLELGRVRLQLTGLAHVERAWLGHDGGAVVRLAQAIADRGDFADMPLLAGALEQAGCADAELLRYCREPGTAACARWVLGLLLSEGDGPAA
jgi:predicted component of type VI protein secretion system